MRNRNLLILSALILFNSCQSKLEKFNSDYDFFKNEYNENLDVTLKNFMSFENIKLDKTLANKKLKEIKLELTEDKFNAILIDQNTFDDINEKPKALDIFNPISKDNLVYINRLLKNEENRMYFLESIRKEGFDFEGYSGPIMQYNEFISFSKKFTKIKYILINYPSRIVLPRMAIEGFYKGEYTGTIALFDFQSKKMLSSFTFSATNSDAIYESSTLIADDRTLYDDLNEQIENSIENKLQEYYTVISYDLEGLELVEYVETE